MALRRLERSDPNSGIYSTADQEGFKSQDFDSDAIGKVGVVHSDLKPSGHITVEGKSLLIEVNNVVVCAGQLSNNELIKTEKETNLPIHVIGGAALAAELDAQRAIAQGAQLAAKL